MTSVQPPHIATSLLRQFGCGSQNDAILGDLIEQYRQGRSRLWYWRQYLTAIAMSVLGEVSRHKLRTLAAITAGWIVFAFYRSAFDRPLFQSLSLQLNFNSFQLKIPPTGHITYWMYVVVLSLAFAAIAFFVGAFSGRVAAKVQPSALRILRLKQN